MCLVFGRRLALVGHHSHYTRLLYLLQWSSGRPTHRFLAARTRRPICRRRPTPAVSPSSVCSTELHSQSTPIAHRTLPASTLYVASEACSMPIIHEWMNEWIFYLPTQIQYSKGSPYSTAEHRVSEVILVLGSQPVGDVSHKPGGRLPLLSARPAVTPATLKRAATNFAAWWTEAQWVWRVCLRL